MTELYWIRFSDSTPQRKLPAGYKDAAQTPLKIKGW